jgi:hypothetical protein
MQNVPAYLELLEYLGIDAEKKQEMMMAVFTDLAFLRVSSISLPLRATTLHFYGYPGAWQLTAQYIVCLAILFRFSATHFHWRCTPARPRPQEVCS